MITTTVKIPHSFQKRQGPPREDAVETEVRRASVRIDGQADAAGPQRGPHVADHRPFPGMGDL